LIQRSEGSEGRKEERGDIEEGRKEGRQEGKKESEKVK